MSGADRGSRIYVGTRLSLPIIGFIIFLILKLTQAIDWSWIWVFAPLWIPLAIDVALGTAIIIVFSIMLIVEAIKGD